MSVNLDENWVEVARVDDFPADGGACVKVGDEQVAVFNFASRGEWYACQNMCPHRKDMVLSRGLLGDQDGEPKVACPFHKKAFSLSSGKDLSDDEYCLRMYDVKVVNEMVMVMVKA